MRMILAQWDSFTLADWDTLPLDSMTSIISGSNQVAYSPAAIVLSAPSRLVAILLPTPTRRPTV